MGSAERRHRPGVGREARGRPGEADLLRAALVEEAGLGAGLRARHPVRRTTGRRPSRAARPAPARRGPGAVHPARAGAGGVAHPAPLLRDQPPAPGGGRGARAPCASPRHRGGRGDALRLLRRAGARRRDLRCALRHLVEAGAPHPARPARLRSLDARPRPCRRGASRRLPGRVARGSHRPAAALPLRARPPGRRRHDRRPPRDPEHRRRRAVHLERARPAPGPRHGTDQVVAQAAPGQLRAGARRRPEVPRGGAARGGAPRPRAVALPALAHRGARARGGVGPGEGA